MTEAPPPATIVQIRPFLFRIVSFKEAPLLESKSAMYASYQQVWWYKLPKLQACYILENHQSWEPLKILLKKGSNSFTSTE